MDRHVAGRELARVCPGQWPEPTTWTPRVRRSAILYATCAVPSVVLLDTASNTSGPVVHGEDEPRELGTGPAARARPQ